VATLASQLQERARQEGFAALRVTRSLSDDRAATRLREFVSLGRHGDMAWMKDTIERRADPRVLWPEARCAIVLAMNYGPDVNPLARLSDRGNGNISVYALGRDYHDVIKAKLKRLAQWLSRTSGAEVKVFVDTAPLMEKPLAARAGLGWQGKHTNLVSRSLGSWFFIGTILTTAELPADDGEIDHCGTCRACLDICPTAAFPAPYRLDARRCLSYLTIEHKGHIPREFRQSMGNRIFGCDDCLAVCPWNKFAAKAAEQKLMARPDLLSPSLAEFLAMDDVAFRKRFAGSPVKRLGRDRFVRNTLIAAGNSDDKTLVPLVEGLLRDASPLVRAMAVWALGRLLTPEEVVAHRNRLLDHETDEDVKSEWSAP
jgi:epoxyqueuosine reductase